MLFIGSKSKWFSTKLSSTSVKAHKCDNIIQQLNPPCVTKQRSSRFFVCGKVEANGSVCLGEYGKTNKQ
jgi:hypothetical protein